MLYILYQSDLDLSLAKQVRMKKTLAFDCSARSVESSIYTIILESESDDPRNKVTWPGSSSDKTQDQQFKTLSRKRRILSLQMIVGGADYHVENDEQPTARNITAPFPTQ